MEHQTDCCEVWAVDKKLSLCDILIIEPMSQTSTSSKLIPLTRNRFAIVDAEDFDYLNQWKWHSIRRKKLCHVARNIRKSNGKRSKIYLHQVILEKREGMETDHINGDGLDNRKSNLRLVTRGQNMMNRALSKNNKSGYKGVSWINKDKVWYSNIRVNRKTISLGHFGCKKRAALAYNVAAKEYFGEFARLNLI